MYNKRWRRWPGLTSIIHWWFINGQLKIIINIPSMNYQWSSLKPFIFYFSGGCRQIFSSFFFFFSSEFLLMTFQWWGTKISSMGYGFVDLPRRRPVNILKLSTNLVSHVYNNCVSHFLFYGVHGLYVFQLGCKFSYMVQEKMYGLASLLEDI